MCKLNYKKKIEKQIFAYFTLSVTPLGEPIETLATTVLYFDTFFSAPYSAINPNVPTLKNMKH